MSSSKINNMFLFNKNNKWEDNASATVKAVRIILLVLIVVGLSLIFTKNLWIPKLVDYILGSTSPTEKIISANFNCADNKTIGTQFHNGAGSYVELKLSDGRQIKLPQAMSASGARYANADESFVFWNKGDTAFITESGSTTFTDCLVSGATQTGSAEQFFSKNPQTFVDKQTGITFEYPEKILAKYISLAEWPPKAQEIHKSFTCEKDLTDLLPPSLVKRKSINGREYCISTFGEGAAGSTYTKYTYAFPYNNTTMTLTFSLRSVQCDNYDDPQKSACKNERALFSPDEAVDRMAQSLTFRIQ